MAAAWETPTKTAHPWCTDETATAPARNDGDDDSFAELPQMVEAATRRELRRRGDMPSPNAVTDRLSALRVSRTTKPAVTPRRRRAAWRGQHGEADVASPLTDGSSPPLEALPQRKVRPEPYYSQPVQ